MELLLLLTIGILGLFAFFQYKQNVQMSRLISRLTDNKLEQEKFIESPNGIPMPDPNIIEMTEENPLDLPKDVKVEVEGGDSFAPLEFTITQKDSKLGLTI